MNQPPSRSEMNPCWKEVAELVIHDSVRDAARLVLLEAVAETSRKLDFIVERRRTGGMAYATWDEIKDAQEALRSCLRALATPPTNGEAP